MVTGRTGCARAPAIYCCPSSLRQVVRPRGCANRLPVATIFPIPQLHRVSLPLHHPQAQGTGQNHGPLAAGRCLRSLAGCAIHRCAALRNGPKDARIMFMHSVLPAAAAAWHWHFFSARPFRSSVVNLLLVHSLCTFPGYNLRRLALKRNPRPVGLHFTFLEAA